MEPKHLGIVTVIIVNWNGKKFIQECLKGLKNQTFYRFSTIIVDNGSRDGSPEFISKNFPDIKLIHLNDNLGFCVANNIAIKSVNTEYIALLNNDAIPHPYWLEHLIGAMESHPEVGFAASKMLYNDHPDIVDRAGDGYTRAGAGFLRGRGEPVEKYDEKEPVFGASAGAAFYRLKMLRDIGLFDEDFFLLYEDVDLNFRAQLKGYPCLYVPEAIVYHLVSRSIGYDSVTSVYYGHRNLEWVYIKNMPNSLICKTFFAHLFYDFMSFLYFMFNGKGHVFLKAKWDAIRGLKKALKKRKSIQNSAKVHTETIWKLMDKEALRLRWT
ncbi:MAG: glycosyltransferase family 2 protein, partial [Desulfobacterales bacterium]